jgi:muramoyltetrapeptide carboxypeptidase LdcA involved in peptidoglycan recycling
MESAPSYPAHTMERKEEMRVPTKLEKGDTITLIAPGGLPPDRFLPQIENSRLYLEGLGFKVDPKIPEQDSLESSKHSLEAAFANTESKAILPVSGGRFSLEVAKEVTNMPHSVQLFCGFSNLYPFVLNNYLSGIVSFYGQHIGFVNDRAPQREPAFNVKNFWTALTKNEKFVSKYGLSNFEQSKLASITEDGALVVPNPYDGLPESIDPHKNDAFYRSYATRDMSEGKNIVICLELMGELIEKIKEVDYKGKIVMIDSFNSTLEEKESYMEKFFQSTNGGDAEAVLFSSFTDTRFVHNFPKEEVELFLEKIAATVGNVAYGFPFGHSKFKTPVPVGVPTEVNFADGTLTFKEYLEG